MPLVRVRIYLGKELLGEPTRPFAREVFKTVVDEALEPFGDGVRLVGTVDVFKDAEDKMRTAQLPINQLGAITIDELISSGFGTNIVTHVESTTAACAGDCAGECGFFLFTPGLTKCCCLQLIAHACIYA